MAGCTRSVGPPAAQADWLTWQAKPLADLVAPLLCGIHPLPIIRPCCAGANPAAPNETAVLWLRTFVSMPCRADLLDSRKVCRSSLDCR